MATKTVNNPPAYKPFLTIRDAVAYTGLSYKYLSQVANDGLVPAIKHGNRTYLPRETLLPALHALAENNKKTPVPAAV